MVPSIAWEFWVAGAQRRARAPVLGLDRGRCVRVLLLWLLLCVTLRQLFILCEVPVAHLEKGNVGSTEGCSENHMR